MKSNYFDGRNQRRKRYWRRVLFGKMHLLELKKRLLAGV
jgi:hypothetical protein